MGKSNQKTVTIIKEVCNKNNLYAAINLAAMEAAMANLSGEGFKLWCYFAKNQGGYKDNLSSSYCKKITGLTTYAYNKAIAELTEKRYLVDENTDPEEVANKWGFYELPREEKKEKPQKAPDVRTTPVHIQSSTNAAGYGIEKFICRSSQPSDKDSVMKELGF